MQQQLDPRIIIAVLTGEATDTESRLLAEWRAASPRHEQHYRRLAELWRAAGTIPPLVEPGPPPSLDRILAGMSEHGRSARFQLRPGHGREAPRPHLGWLGPALAAAALVAVGIGLGELADRREARQPGPAFGAEDFVTGPSEVATLTLRDGTVVRLAPSSRLSVGQDPREREVSLRGRAYFAVARSRLGPFTVRMPAGEATVLGTRFDANATESGLEVVVVDGRVKVVANGGQVSVTANQMAQVENRGTPVVERVDDLYDRLAWLGHFLAFEATPLAEVAEEFRKRFDLRIEINDSSLANMTITGWFTAQTPEEMLEAMCRAVDAQCTTRAGVVEITAAAVPPRE